MPTVKRVRQWVGRAPNAHCRQGQTPPLHDQHIDVVVYQGCNALVVV